MRDRLHVLRGSSRLGPSSFTTLDMTGFAHGDEVVVEARATDVNGNASVMS